MKALALVLLLAGSAAFAQGQAPSPSSASDVGAVPTSRAISAGTGLSGGGDLSADRTISCVPASNVANGCVTNTTQTFSGDKTFQGTLTVQADGGTTFQLTDGTNTASMKPAASGVLSLSGGLTVNGVLNMPTLTSITWPAGAAGLTQGAGQYTGTCEPLPNGASWPIPATLFHTGTVGANSSTTETTLVQQAHTNQFGQDATVAGRGWHVRAMGTFAANNNAKTVKLKFGPTQTDVTNGLFTGTTATNNVGWRLDCIIERTTGASAQLAACEWKYGTTSGTSVLATSEATGTNDWTVTLTGTGGATNDIANALMRNDYLP